MNTEPLTEDEREVGWALLTGPMRGVQVDQLVGRVALPLPRVKGAVRSLSEAGRARSTPSGYWLLTDAGAFVIAADVAAFAGRNRDAMAQAVARNGQASYAELAEVLGISKSAAFHRYGPDDETP